MWSEREMMVMFSMGEDVEPMVLRVDMKKNTSQIVRAVLQGDDTIRADQRDTVLAVLSEKGQGGALPLLVTQAQAARMLSVSRITIFRMVRDGQLAPVLVRGLRRYRREDLERIAKHGDAQPVEHGDPAA